MPYHCGKQQSAFGSSATPVRMHIERLAAARGRESIKLTSAFGRDEAHAFYRAVGYAGNLLRFRKALIVS
jgi:hypothetical protein